LAQEAGPATVEGGARAASRAAWPGEIPSRFLTRRATLAPGPVGWRPRLLPRLRTDLVAKSIFFHGRAGTWRSLSMLPKDGSLATVLHRITRALGKWHLGLLGAMVYKLSALLTGAVIGRKAEIGPGLVILHGHGIVINNAVRIGANAVLGHNVTIGTEKGRAPVLGDHVYVGTGAVIIGGIRVGHRARIGANAVVNKDVPDGATAVGVPARVIKVRSFVETCEDGGTQEDPSRKR